MTSTNQSIQILTVSELTQAIKLNLENAFPSIQLQGEVSNFKRQSSGHLYFSLKDNQAQISVVMFRGNAARLKKMPKDGDQVIVDGEINVYAPGGRYQIVVRSLRQVGLGDLLLKLEELKVKLHERGWFSKKHKKALPKFPKTIGVVTSPTGAAIQDMLNVLTRRFSGFHLILYPVKVQGDGSAQEIAQAIREFNRFHLVDVMIIGRGGGSIEDLWAFNEEIVAEAIFESEIPIISAVGHETDHCIADYVADVRAPTPSAAAEIVIAEKNQQLKHLTQMQERLHHSVSQLVRSHRKQLTGVLKQPVFLTPYALLGPWIQKADDLRQQLSQGIKQLLAHKRQYLEGRKQHVYSLKPSALITHHRQQLNQWQRSLYQTTASLLIQSRSQLLQKNDRLQQMWQTKLESRQQLFCKEAKQNQLKQYWQRYIELRKERLNQLILSLNSIDPKNLLKNGYSILFSEKDNSVITSIQSLKNGDRITALLADGKLSATIGEIPANE